MSNMRQELNNLNDSLAHKETRLNFNITDLIMHENIFTTTKGGMVFVSVSCITDLTNDYGSVDVDIIYSAKRYARDSIRTDTNSATYRGACATTMFVSTGSNLSVKYGSTITGKKEVIINIVAFGCEVNKIQ